MLLPVLITIWATIASPAKSGRSSIPLGGIIDRDPYRVTRALPDAPPGLTVVPLDAHALARSNELADVRIVDAAGRQVPYVVETRPDPVVVVLRVPPREGNEPSVYAVKLPHDRWPEGTRLVLTTTAEVFDRHVTVRRRADDHRNRRSRRAVSVPWRNDKPEIPAPPFEVAMPSRAGEIEIVIDEGDNAPLPIASARLLLPGRALRFDHPGGKLFLLYGNRQAAPPRYDISLLASRLFAAKAREMTLPAGPIQERRGDDRSGRTLFWAGIVVAAVVLSALLLRLVLVRPETSRAPNDTR